MTDPSELDVFVSKLCDAVALWLVGPITGAGEVIDAATEALVQGLDSPTLRELAGASPQNSYWDLKPLIEATFAELGVSDFTWSEEDQQVAAARVMARRLLAGDLSPRAMAYWAHTVVGHEGAPRVQPFVEFDDEYDEGEYALRDVQAIDQDVRTEAQRLVDGLPALPIPPWTQGVAVAKPTRRWSPARLIRRVDKPPKTPAPEPVIEESPSFEYKLTGAGWSQARIQIDSTVAQLSASYLDDALGELVAAVLAVLEGAHEARASWTEEPGEFRWILTPQGADVHVRILWFDDIYSGSLDERGRTHFDATCPMTDFASAVATGAQAALDEHGEAGYRERWVEHDFPTVTLRELQALLAD